MNLLQKQTTFSGYIGWNKLEYLSKTDKMSHVIQLQTLIFVLYWIEAGIFYTDLCVAELELHNLYLRRFCLFQRKVCETNHGAKQMKELSGMSHFSPEQFDFGTLGFQITAYLWQWQNRRKKKQFVMIQFDVQRRRCGCRTVRRCGHYCLYSIDITIA